MLTANLLDTDLLAAGLLADPMPVPPPLPRQSDDVYYHLGSAGRCSGQQRLFIFASDDSGSVTSGGGNDPLSRRYAEARLAVRTLARACRCGRELAAVAHWDKSGFDVPPTGLGRSGLAEVLAGLAMPNDAAGTSNLGPVLGRIKQLVRHPSLARHQAHLVVMSDFELTDPDPASVFDQLNHFPGKVTALVLGGRSADQIDNRLDTDRIQVARITADDEPGRLARVLFDGLTEDRAGRWLV
jgi:hypothetical protein